MSPIGHADGVAVVMSGRLDLPTGQWFDEHDHDLHQLAWASHGVLSVRAHDRTWVLSPGLALWIPAGLRHTTGAASAAGMLGVYLRPARCPIRWRQPTVVAVDALTRELLGYLLGDPPASERRHAESLLFAQLRPVRDVPLDVPLPTHDRACAVTEALVADPSDRRSLAEHGRIVGASSRTLARAWSAETGIGFARWRTRVRVRAALPLLASGTAVSSVSKRVGYDTPSAFVAAFRRELGVTPGTYFAAS